MVNIFLPYASIEKTAKTLDNKRLGKQRVEAFQIINVIENPNPKGWRNHPAVKMVYWYPNFVKHYCNIMIDEWISRGFKNTMKKYEITGKIIYPWWFGNEDFHYSHQASLLRKDNKYYKDKFEDIPEKYKEKGYIWPKFVNGKKCLEFSPVSDYKKKK